MLRVVDGSTSSTSCSYSRCGVQLNCSRSSNQIVWNVSFIFVSRISDKRQNNCYFCRWHIGNEETNKRLTRERRAAWLPRICVDGSFDLAVASFVPDGSALNSASGVTACHSKWLHARLRVNSQCHQLLLKRQFHICDSSWLPLDFECSSTWNENI